MLMPKPPLMPGTDTMVVDTDMVPDTMAVTVWDTTDTDTVWDTVVTTDTDIPVLTVMPTTTLARGPLMLGTDTMAVDTDMADTDMVDTGMAADTADTTVMANRFLNSNILPFF